MDQDQIDALVGGEDTDLHKHDQRYYTEAELNGGILDSRYYTETEIDANIYTKTEVDTALGLKADDADVLKHDGSVGLSVDWDIGDGRRILADAIQARDAGQLFMYNQAGTGYVYIGANVSINMTTVISNGYLQVSGNEGVAGTIYLYADQGDENADKWKIEADIDGSFSIENFTTGSWVSFLDIGSNKNILMYGGLQAFRDIGATAAWMSVGFNRTASESARLDLIGDTTYTDYGLRIIRGSGGQNATSQIVHRGTGAFSIIADEAADIVFETNSISALRIASSGALDVVNSACVLDEDAMGSDSPTQLATKQNIKAYIDNKSYLDLGSILTGDGAYVGTKMTVTVDDASTIFGDVLAQAADFNYDRADASAAANSVGLVMALSGGSGSKEVLIEGQVCETDWTWSAGLLYLSITTGKMTQTAPVASGEQVVAVGWALSADTIYFKPSLVLAEIA